ncbi:MAG: redoxin domain-containing protein [Phycisphaerales bacterium]|nr:redoxin domain-containing protein [Phycisphaerales bacterium]
MQRELETKGGTVVAVSVDSPGESREVVEKFSLAFPILSDSQRSVIRQYGLLHEKGSPTGEDIAIPAAFLVDRDGRVLWRHVAQRIQDRVDPQAVLDEVKKQFSSP